MYSGGYNTLYPQKVKKIMRLEQEMLNDLTHILNAGTDAATAALNFKYLYTQQLKLSSS
jgi:hypothetical protein